MANNVLQVEKIKCFGCRACEQKCLQKAIQFNENKEGFIFPNVNENCNSCGLCLSVCPAINETQNIEKLHQIECYAAVSKNLSLLKKSSSGGVATVLSEKIIKNNGIVFGCIFDENLNAVMTSTESLTEITKFQGSKYVFSDSLQTFSEVKTILCKSDKKVLYIGRPCQITGLKKFLGRDYENLFTVDLICHGVPSQKLFSKYLEWLGKKNGGKIIYYGFRDKDVGGWSCGGKTKTKTKTKVLNGSIDPYYSSFLKGETYRECCYVCPFANENRIGDITIGDFWGVEKYHHGIDCKNGISAVLVNTSKGKKIWSECEENFEITKTLIENVKSENLNLHKPTNRPNCRDLIYSRIDEKNYIELLKKRISIKKRLYISLISVIPQKIKKILKKIVWRAK